MTTKLPNPNRRPTGLTPDIEAGILAAAAGLSADAVQAAPPPPRG